MSSGEQADRKIDGHLNFAINRFQLNRAKKVGKIEDAISSAVPTSIDEWQDYYYKNILSEDGLRQVGKDLHSRFTDQIIPEVNSITEDDCIEYVKSLVIVKSYEGYQARLEILQNELLSATKKQFEFKADHANDWRFKTYQIDFFHLDVSRDLLIGIKVFPVSFLTSQNPLVIKSRQSVESTHKDSEAKKAGRFFIIYYEKLSKDTYRLSNSEPLQIIESL